MTDVLAMGLNIEQEIVLQKQAQNISLESELFSIPIQDYQQFYCQRFLEATKLDYTMAGHPSSECSLGYQFYQS
ncbi:hypothetical protein COO91_04360 [Nostoc flagelliforme CCNUN1]|uniref:Uncharacterized protein n=1 Tax=Nostoc flagelliforme CCNUN1 TaxID=2038116 RepID=A0A2K8SSR3_9NOSO|nr:hypothetical protein COO91_04360 [Nostoc flagelliforme CCNUN1]